MTIQVVGDRQSASRPVTSMGAGQRRGIMTFRDLEVFKSLSVACRTVMFEVLPALPNEEKYDLRDQLRRSCKAAPRLVAEGYAKKHQIRGFQKYIDDAMAECNETIVSIEQCRDLYGLPSTMCDQLIDTYDKCARQLYKLALAWSVQVNVRRKSMPFSVTGSDSNRHLPPLHNDRPNLTA